MLDAIIGKDEDDFYNRDEIAALMNIVRENQLIEKQHKLELAGENEGDHEEEEPFTVNEIKGRILHLILLIL